MFNGKYGLIAYNKNNGQKKQRQNPVEEWIVSVGEHPGIIDSKDWILAQKKIKANSKLSYRSPQKSNALLSGIVRCACCGSFMRPKSSRKAKDGTLHFFYVCEQKEKSRGNLCHVKNIPGRLLDELVAERIFLKATEIISEHSFMEAEINRLEKAANMYSETLISEKQIERTGKQIETLLAALAKSTNETTTDSILKKINQLNEKQQKLKERQRLNKPIETDSNLAETLAGKIILMDKGLFDILPAATKKELLSKVMKEVSWNGKNAVIHLLAEA